MLMITNISNLIRMWTGQAISNKRPSLLFCVLGLILQYHFSSLVMFVSGLFILTMCLGRIQGYGLALSWGLLPAAITSAATMDHPDRDVVLTVVYMFNLIIVYASQMRMKPQNSFTKKVQGFELTEDALRAARRLSMPEPLMYKAGPVLGSYRGVLIPEFIEDVAGMRYLFLRVEPGPIACIQEGEIIMAPGFVFASATPA